MDTALQLRIAFEEKTKLNNKQISAYLNASKLVLKLTKPISKTPLSSCFRIMGLSEIPYAEKLDFTQDLLAFINHNVATEQGFSCLGGIKEIVPCYNAMLLEAYCRLGMAHSKPAEDALNWILNYQLFERNKKSTWPYKGICKHGGCLGKTPCYIGVGKSVRALITYAEYINKENKAVNICLNKGIEYMLQHKIYLTLSSNKPISAHITDIMMPQNYALSFTDLIYIVAKQNLQSNPNTQPLFYLLNQKENSPNKWKIDYVYKYNGYVAFENRRNTSQWVSHLFSVWLNL